MKGFNKNITKEHYVSEEVYYTFEGLKPRYLIDIGTLEVYEVNDTGDYTRIDKVMDKKEAERKYSFKGKVKKIT